MIPLKVKFFLRRACVQSLPARDRLLQKWVWISIYHPIYNVEVESMSHLFFSCPMIKSCWLLCGVYIFIPSSGLNMLDSIAKFLRINRENVRESITLCWWSMWFFKNQIIWHKPSITALLVVNLARIMLGQWLEGNSREPRRGSATVVHSWSCPSSGMAEMQYWCCSFQ